MVLLAAAEWADKSAADLVAFAAALRRQADKLRPPHPQIAPLVKTTGKAQTTETPGPLSWPPSRRHPRGSAVRLLIQGVQLHGRPHQFTTAK